MKEKRICCCCVIHNAGDNDIQEPYVRTGTMWAPRWTEWLVPHLKSWLMNESYSSQQASQVTVVSKQASTQSKASIQASLGYPAVNSFLKQETPGGWRNSWESGNSAHGKAVCCSAALSHFPHHTKNHATDSTKMLQSSSLPIQCCEVHLGFLSNPIFIHLKFLAISEFVFIAILI